MSDLFWLTDEQMERLRPFFPKSHGKPRVDDRRVLSSIVFVNRNGLRWRDAPSEYGPHKTLLPSVPLFNARYERPAMGQSRRSGLVRRTAMVARSRHTTCPSYEVFKGMTDSLGDIFIDAGERQG
jgi:transposase